MKTVKVRTVNSLQSDFMSMGFNANRDFLKRAAVQSIRIFQMKRDSGRFSRGCQLGLQHDEICRVDLGQGHSSQAGAVFVVEVGD